MWRANGHGESSGDCAFRARRRTRSLVKTQENDRERLLAWSQKRPHAERSGGVDLFIEKQNSLRSLATDGKRGGVGHSRGLEMMPELDALPVAARRSRIHALAYINHGHYFQKRHWRNERRNTRQLGYLAGGETWLSKKSPTRCLHQGWYSCFAASASLTTGARISIGASA